MKVKNVKLEYYVIQHDMNKGKIERYNVLGGNFAETLYKEFRRRGIHNREGLKEWLKSDFMYHYWSKSECEILVGPLHLGNVEDELEKIDIWYQLEPNLDVITDYIIKEMQIEFKN